MSSAILLTHRYLYPFECIQKDNFTAMQIYIFFRYIKNKFSKKQNGHMTTHYQSAYYTQPTTNQ